MSRRPVYRTAPTGVTYRYVYEPDHPLAHSDGYVPEHRKVAWDGELLREAGRHLTVRHLNGDGLDNRLENLWVGTQGEAACEFGSNNQHGTFQCRAQRCAAWDGCERPVRCGDLCDLHHRRWEITGDPLGVLRHPPDRSEPYTVYRRDHASRPTARRACSLDGCDRSGTYGDLCPTHYRRLRKWGDPLIVHRVMVSTLRPFRLVEP